MLVEGDAGDAHAADGARVSGHAARDGAYDGDLFVPASSPEVGIVDEERGRRPNAAPARGEGHGASGFLRGEAGNDVGEQIVREAADVVLPVIPRRRKISGPIRGVLFGLGVGGGEREVVVIGVGGVVGLR